MLHASLALKILDFLDVRFGTSASWLFLLCDVKFNDFYASHTARVASRSEIHKRWKVTVFFFDWQHVSKFPGKYSFHQGDYQFSDESRGLHEIFMILSAFLIPIEVWRNWFRHDSWRCLALPENYCWQQTMVCQVVCPRHNHTIAIIPPIQSTPIFLIRETTIHGDRIT